MPVDRLKILRFIVGALILGVVMFGLLTIVLAGPAKVTNFYIDTISLVITVVAIACVATSYMVSRALDKAMEDSLRGSGTVAQIDEQLYDRLQQRTIVGCAVLEGGAFLIVVFNLIRPNLLFLLLAVVMLAAMSFYFPTESRVQQWHRQRREGITQKKSLN